MIRLWVNGSACTVPQDIEIEFTYNTSDAEGLETQCSSYSTSFALPRDAANMAIFTPLFDIRTVFGSASFDIHANAPAVLEISNQGARGYVKMEYVDDSFHLRFYNGAGLLLEKLRNTKLADLPFEAGILLPYRQSAANLWKDTYKNLYGTGTADEYYVLFPAFKNDEETFAEYTAGVGAGENVISPFRDTYRDENGVAQKINYGFTEHQATLYRKSHLRCAAQVKHLFELVMTASGFTADYTTDFFTQPNPYWTDLFMVLRQQLGDGEAVSYYPNGYMPDMSCEEFILGYCKLFGLRIELTGNTVHFYTRREWYDIYNIVDISEGVDRKTGITVKPNPYADANYGAWLDCNGEDAGYNISEGGTNLYDGIPFKFCEMMQYSGPMVASWTNFTGVGYDVWYMGGTQNAAFSLPFIDSTEGGELLFRGDNLASLVFWVINDYLANPCPDLQVGSAPIPGAVRKIVTPNMTALNDTYPLYSYKDRVGYNYAWKNMLPSPQSSFPVLFKNYTDEICSKDNVEIDAEGFFTPSVINRLASTKPLVWLDGVLCRVIECVTNRIDRCKLRLQKITDKTNLIAGQLFTGYYLRTVGSIWVPSTDTIGTEYTLPVETNDAINYVAQGFFAWSVSDPITVVLDTAPSGYTVTFAGHAGVYRPKWDSIQVRTVSGLVELVYYCQFYPGCVVSYGHTPQHTFAESGRVVFSPLQMTRYIDPNDGTVSVLRIRNSVTGALWQDNAAYEMSVSTQGYLVIEALDATSVHSASVVVSMESPDGSKIYAISETFSIMTDPV